MSGNTKKPANGWLPVLEYKPCKDIICSGSQKVTDDGISVNWQVAHKGKVGQATSATRQNEEDAKIFFYNKLRGKLRGSWMIMETLIEKTVKPFHAKMKVIEDKIPAAVIAKYEEILGPLHKVDQQKIDEAIVELQNICDRW